MCAKLRYTNIELGENVNDNAITWSSYDHYAV
jgi:hypothetical protein